MRPYDEHKGKGRVIPLAPPVFEKILSKMSAKNSSSLGSLEIPLPRKVSQIRRPFRHQGNRRRSFGIRHSSISRPPNSSINSCKLSTGRVGFRSRRSVAFCWSLFCGVSWDRYPLPSRGSVCWSIHVRLFPASCLPLARSLR